MVPKSYDRTTSNFDIASKIFLHHSEPISRFTDKFRESEMLLFLFTALPQFSCLDSYRAVK